MNIAGAAKAIIENEETNNTQLTITNEYAHSRIRTIPHFWGRLTYTFFFFYRQHTHPLTTPRTNQHTFLWHELRSKEHTYLSYSERTPAGRSVSTFRYYKEHSCWLIYRATPQMSSGSSAHRDPTWFIQVDTDICFLLHALNVRWSRCTFINIHM